MASPIIPVSLFSDAALQRQVDELMDTLPPGSSGAILVKADLEGASIVVTQAGEHWSVKLAAGITYTGEKKAELMVAAHW